MTRMAMRALTTREAAAELGVTPASFRGRMARERKVHGVDLRTPSETWPALSVTMYDAHRFRQWLAKRPGRGKHSTEHVQLGSLVD